MGNGSRDLAIADANASKNHHTNTTVEALLGTRIGRLIDNKPKDRWVCSEFVRAKSWLERINSHIALENKLWQWYNAI